MLNTPVIHIQTFFKSRILIMSQGRSNICSFLVNSYFLLNTTEMLLVVNIYTIDLNTVALKCEANKVEKKTIKNSKPV